ncbi:MAG: cell wall hydrolase [Pseudomonadota bacterium]|nr:cell wall hydrolase [Pseudomonadota bacterium]
MTALRSNLSTYRWIWVLAGCALALLAAAGLLEGRRAEAQVASATIVIAPARAAALVDATSGEAGAAVKAVGDKAQMINAAMPFDGSPVRAARPFELGGEGLDHRRALLCLTQAVYYEAGFEPMTGRRAVAQVVLNRMRHPAYPKSVCGVVYQKNKTPVCQFSFVCDGSLLRQPASGAWRQAHDVAAAALAGYVELSVGSATHYHADYVAPRWAPMLAKVAKLGAHIFYRWPGTWGLPAAFTGRYIGEPSDPAALRPMLRAVIDGAPVDPAIAQVEVVAGPPIARAPNDVGGLLDTSRGWTLNIPLPSEAGSATKAIANKQLNPPAAAAVAPVGPAPAIASR